MSCLSANRFLLELILSPLHAWSKKSFLEVQRCHPKSWISSNPNCCQLTSLMQLKWFSFIFSTVIKYRCTVAGHNSTDLNDWAFTVLELHLLGSKSKFCQCKERCDQTPQKCSCYFLQCSATLEALQDCALIFSTQISCSWCISLCHQGLLVTMHCAHSYGIGGFKTFQSFSICFMLISGGEWEKRMPSSREQ